jgi:hypothetical protein
MKKLIALALCLSFFYGCGDPKVINGKKYDTYGLLNANEKKNENIEYHLVVGSIICSVFFVETIIAPIYCLGFDLYEPVGVKGNVEKGVVN